MSINKLALIRYKTIDTCLSNRRRRWTLEDLILKVGDVLYETEGITTGVSRRTIQADLQTMRSDKLGYNAPIIITDKKYYSYADTDYSISKAPVNAADMERMREVLRLLKGIAGIGQLADLGSLVTRLEHSITTAGNETSCIQFETVDGLRGLRYLEPLYSAIRSKRPLAITYQSFKAKKPATSIYHPYLLKEYRNRWFLFAKARKGRELNSLALDRIIDIGDAPGELFIPYTGTSFDTYFSDLIGVTKTEADRPQKVVLEFDCYSAPYVLTKPLHHSQKVLRQDENSTILQINVIVNFELLREVLGFGDGVKVLAPRSLQKRIQEKLERSCAKYQVEGVRTELVTEPGIS